MYYNTISKHRPTQTSLVLFLIKELDDVIVMPTCCDCLLNGLCEFTLVLGILVAKRPIVVPPGLNHLLLYCARIRFLHRCDGN